MYLFLHKSWIWRTLGHVMENFSCWHFHNGSKEYFWPKKFLNFMHGFKSAILAIFRFCKNSTFEPVREIQENFLPKVFFWSTMKMPTRKFFRIMTQGPPNPGFMQEKVQKGDFLKKPSRKLKKKICSRFEWIPRRPGTLNQKRLVFLPSKNLYNQCESHCTEPKSLKCRRPMKLKLTKLGRGGRDWCFRYKSSTGLML